MNSCCMTEADYKIEYIYISNRAGAHYFPALNREPS